MTWFVGIVATALLLELFTWRAEPSKREKANREGFEEGYLKALEEAREEQQRRVLEARRRKPQK